LSAQNPGGGGVTTGTTSEHTYTQKKEISNYNLKK